VYYCYTALLKLNSLKSTFTVLSFSCLGSKVYCPAETSRNPLLQLLQQQSRFQMGNVQRMAPRQLMHAGADDD